MKFEFLFSVLAKQPSFSTNIDHVTFNSMFPNFKYIKNFKLNSEIPEILKENAC